MQQQNDYKKHREKLFKAMLPNSIALLPTAPIIRRSADQNYRFYPDNDFYYFTGYPEPEAVAVLIKSEQKGERYILFNRRKDPAQEQWSGIRIGQEAALKEYLVDEAYPIDELMNKLPELTSNKEALYFTWGRYTSFDETIKNCLNKIRDKIRAGFKIPDHCINLESIVSEMRLIKDSQEIAWLRKAAEITTLAHKQAMRACYPGSNEYQVKAELIYGFLKQGGMGEAYDSIVAGGENACILHYTVNNQPLKANELLLIDAAAKYNFYCADVTRTYPISSKFTGEQKAIYEIVYEAQLAAIKAAKPGICWLEMELTARRVITPGLIKLGVLKGDIEELLAQNAYAPFYMHRIGHWLGMDVHDVGRYKENGQWRTLQSGMVTTIEPGIYIKPGLPVDRRWWGIGIRIEDNVVITDSGVDILTIDMPKKASEIEMLVSEK